MIVQVWVLGSKPGTGTLSAGAVEAGMSKTMLSVPGLGSALAARIAARSDPATARPPCCPRRRSKAAGAARALPARAPVAEHALGGDWPLRYGDDRRET